MLERSMKPGPIQSTSKEVIERGDVINRIITKAGNEDISMNSYR